MSGNSKIDVLLKRKVSWLADSGPEDDIAISTRIRLARNLVDVPFPIAASADSLRVVRDSVVAAINSSAALGATPLEFDMEQLSDIERKTLLERRLISREFLSGRQGSALVVDAEESTGVMINEEDHLRMQAVRPGFQLKEVWSQINTFDDALALKLPFAFDKALGFLTSCPTNVGTGMRSSVMLHLPGLVLAGQINAVIQGINKLGLAVRGFFGEGTENLGNLYQISNQSTLGESEEQILDRLGAVISQIIAHEKGARAMLLDKRQNFLLNHVGRAYGILKHAYAINSEEALNSLSALRLGVDMGMFSSVDIRTVNELFVLVQPAHLQRHAAKELDSEERDVVRATIIRERLRSHEQRK